MNRSRVLVSGRATVMFFPFNWGLNVGTPATFNEIWVSHNALLAVNAMVIQLSTNIRTTEIPSTIGVAYSFNSVGGFDDVDMAQLYNLGQS